MQCPICRADNQSPGSPSQEGGGPQCRRCRADLSLLWSLEAQRRRALVFAYHAVAADDPGRLLDLALYAGELRRDDESSRLVILGHLLGRDFAAAWNLYRSRIAVRSQRETMNH